MANQTNLFDRLYQEGNVGCARLPVETCFNFKISDQYMNPPVGKSAFSNVDGYGNENYNQNNCAHHLLNGQRSLISTSMPVQTSMSNDNTNHGDNVNGNHNQPNVNLHNNKAYSNLNLNVLNSNNRQEIVEFFSKVKNNPDFATATKMIINGGKGIAEYFVTNLPHIVEQAGGASADQVNSIMENLKRSALMIGQTVQELMNKITVGETIESFMNVYEDGQYQLPPRIQRDLNNKIDTLKQDGEFYCYLLSNYFGNMTVGELINKFKSCVETPQKLLNEYNHLMQKDLNQAGGLNISNEFENFFQYTRRGIDLVSSQFKTKMINEGAPPYVTGYLDQLNNGLVLALTTLQNQFQQQFSNSSLAGNVIQAPWITTTATATTPSLITTPAFETPALTVPTVTAPTVATPVLNPSLVTTPVVASPSVALTNRMLLSNPVSTTTALTNPMLTTTTTPTATITPTATTVVNPMIAPLPTFAPIPVAANSEIIGGSKASGNQIAETNCGANHNHNPSNNRDYFHKKGHQTNARANNNNNRQKNNNVRFAVPHPEIDQCHHIPQPGALAEMLRLRRSLPGCTLQGRSLNRYSSPSRSFPVRNLHNHVLRPCTGDHPIAGPYLDPSLIVINGHPVRPPRHWTVDQMNFVPVQMVPIKMNFGQY